MQPHLLLTKSSKEGTADGQGMGSGTSMLERNPQRERLREGKEPGAWGAETEVQCGPVPGDEGGGAEAGRDVMKGGGWEESGRGYQDVLCL